MIILSLLRCYILGRVEYTRYGFRKLIETKSIDILQPDVMWVGGMTELLKISAMAAAYDLPVVPHGSGPLGNIIRSFNTRHH